MDDCSTGDYSTADYSTEDYSTGGCESVEQGKQQDVQPGTASVYVQPEPGHGSYPPFSPPPYSSHAVPTGSILTASAAAAALPYPEYPPQQYAASYSAQQYPPAYRAAGGTAVTGYPAAPVQPAAGAAGPVQGIPAAAPASEEPDRCCTVGMVLFLVSHDMELNPAAVESHQQLEG
jgi:hypothetical protein